MGYRDGLKSSFIKLDALTALHSPISALLGVSTESEQILKHFGIHTIYDLATASIFNTAADIARAANGEGNNSVIACTGRIPGDFIDQDSPATPVALAAADVVLLRDIGTELASTIKSSMQIETVGDLGRWPPFLAAKLILNATVPSQEEIEEASELVPRFGEYPTELHYYRSVMIDHVVPGETKDLTTAGPIDISPTVSTNFGFKAPAVGAILTFAQSWYAQGMALGNLLHSVALAPGESTRIAVLDWARRTQATGTETISESEQLTNTTTHNRAISEVQQAVANEVQNGFSRTSGSSSTSAGGGGFGLSLGPLTLGGSGSTATTSTNAESFSSSAGSRELAASMNQRVSDATQQAASSVRDRRASIVKEVSEEEHETISTRILANYNHMHALTIQYFEVIEIYRVNVQLHQVERCLFVPMKLVDFTDALIERYQGILANAALTRRARELLSHEFNTVSIQPAVPMPRRGNIFDRVSNVDSMVLNTARLSRATATNTTSTAENPEQLTPPVAPTAPTVPPVIMSAINPLAWLQDEILRASRITMVSVTKPGKNNLYLPGQTELTGISFTITAQNNGIVAISNVQIVTHSGSPITLTALSPIDWTIPSGVPLQEINQLRVSTTSTSRMSGKITLQLTYGSASFPITLPVEINPNAAGQPLLHIVLNDTTTELRIHLEQNRLHYSQAIWRALDTSSIALLLSEFTFEEKPVADQIDPNPVMIASNYLVFRMPGFVETVGISTARRDEDETSAEVRAYKNWKEWLKDHGLILGSNVASEQLVPIPTGGVFAEAVLGRSNSAERLDATRFWNWQDSPIPLQPPEIAAIQMQSRSQPVDVSPGHLSSPVLNITNPTQLPDPTGVGSIINAVQNGNMFRDMAGLAATAGIAQALSTNATNAGTEAGKQAAANLAVAAQKDIEEKRIAAQLAMAAMGLPAGSGGTPKNISESGALLNTANSMDKKSPLSKGTTSTGSSENMDEDMGGIDTGTTPIEEYETDGSYMPGVPEEVMETFGIGENESRADNVLSKMTWGSLGTSGGNLMLATKKKKRSPSLASGTIIFELASYANFPRPWPDDATEITAIKNKIWLPSGDYDLDDVTPAATAAKGGTKPRGQFMSMLEDVIVSVTFFAPKIIGFSGSRPSRVKRLNLFLFATTQTLEFSGTLKTNGTWTSVLNPSLDIKSTVVDASILSNILTNTSNSGTLATLRTAWDVGAEIWLYTCGSVPDDALCQAFATLMGAKVKAFTEPFWVLPRYDSTQTTITSRKEFGIGADFTAATSKRTKKLHTLDALATRTFNP
jgi:hypothetical protein